VKRKEKEDDDHQKKKKIQPYGAGSDDPSSKQSKDKDGSGRKLRATCQLCGKVGHKTKRSRKCTYTTWRPEENKGENRRFHVVRWVVLYVNIFGTCKYDALTLRTVVPEGNLGDPSTEKGDSTIVLNQPR
jgi:hypothetical protein